MESSPAPLLYSCVYERQAMTAAEDEKRLVHHSSANYKTVLFAR